MFEPFDCLVSYKEVDYAMKVSAKTFIQLKNNKINTIFPTLLKLSGWEVLRVLQSLEYSQEEVTKLFSNLNLPVTLKSKLGKMHWTESASLIHENIKMFEILLNSQYVHSSSISGIRSPREWIYKAFGTNV